MAAHRLAPRPPAHWRAYVYALVGILLLGWLIDLVTSSVHLANVSMIYLIAVLAIAVVWGGGPAVLAAVAAFLSLGWFFVTPMYTFQIVNPDEWLVALTFLVTAIVTGELAGTLRKRAHEAQQREREASLLADVLRLMIEADLEAAVNALAERLQGALRLDAVAVEVTDSTLVTATAHTGSAEALAIARRACASKVVALPVAPPAASGWRDAVSRWLASLWVPLEDLAVPVEYHWLLVAPVNAHDRRIGSIAFVRAGNGPPFSVAEGRLATAVATQLSLICERERLRRESTEVEILRRTDDVKTALLHAVSHDLRTPLSSIIAAAGSLLEEDVNWSAQEQHEFAQTIRTGAQRLNQIVENLLDLSRIEGGILRPQLDWYDLWALVDDVLGRLRAMTAGHTLVVDIPDDLPLVQLDYVQTCQVLTNLLENATKYTPPGAEIRISAEHGVGEIRVVVEDSGPGVPEHALPHLFDKFYRVGPPGLRPSGTGLGLAVAKGLVEAHGGRIWVENRPEGGARFVFTIPLGTPTEVPPAAKEMSV